MKAAPAHLRKGDVVWHKKFGTGIVEREWGSWWCCSVCRSYIVEVKLEPKAYDKRQLVTPVRCSHGHVSLPLQINGRGVFEVKFSFPEVLPVHYSVLKVPSA
jgi:hypothetical protein